MLVFEGTYVRTLLHRRRDTTVVKPRPVTADLRLGTNYLPLEPTTAFAYSNEGHRFSEAANRCVGVGKCRGHESGVMCPSYRATQEEEHSTRGRARILFEMMAGEVIEDGWRSVAVRDALDLCLACKGCLSDCPVNVDMASYKAEFLHHHYRRRLRPMAHYPMGWLPLLAQAAALAPRIVNAATQAPALSGGLKRLGGIDPRRQLPRFADQRFTRWFAHNRRASAPYRGPNRVLLWPDTFTNHFDPEIARDAVSVLESAGFDVEVPTARLCCGLTWISTGQLQVAKAVLRRTLRALRPYLHDGTPVVVLEPSCAAVFRSDLVNLLPGNEDAHRLAAQTATVGELLSERADDCREPHWQVRVMVQPHCHQHAVLHYTSEQQLLEQGAATENWSQHPGPLPRAAARSPGNAAVSACLSGVPVVRGIRAHNAHGRRGEPAQRCTKHCEVSEDRHGEYPSSDPTRHKDRPGHHRQAGCEDHRSANPPSAPARVAPDAVGQFAGKPGIVGTEINRDPLQGLLFMLGEHHRLHLSLVRLSVELTAAFRCTSCTPSAMHTWVGKDSVRTAAPDHTGQSLLHYAILSQSS